MDHIASTGCGTSTRENDLWRRGLSTSTASSPQDALEDLNDELNEYTPVPEIWRVAEFLRHEAESMSLTATYGS